MPAKKIWAALICHHCGVTYEVQPHRASVSKCCSKKCLQHYAATFAAHIQEAKRGTGTKHRYVKRKSRHEHRIVAEEKMGRALLDGEIVHHIDGDGHNNHPDNLQVMTQSQHIELHRTEMITAQKAKASRA